jgi:exodeoxyribonuclease-3
MKIFSWNLNGIRSVLKKDLFYTLINNELPDIICLQETRATSDQVKFEKDFIKEYPFRYWSNHKTKKGYSGTAIFSKIEPISIDYAENFPHLENQGRITCCEFEKYFVVSVYVPNSGTNMSIRTDFDNSFKEYLESKTKPVISAGDYNVICSKTLDLHNSKIKNVPGIYDFEIDNLKNLLKSFKDTFREKFPNTIKFSWWSNFNNCRKRGVGWRIDYILVSPELLPLVETSDILTEHMGSDHAPIFMCLYENAILAPINATT